MIVWLLHTNFFLQKILSVAWRNLSNCAEWGNLTNWSSLADLTYWDKIGFELRENSIVSHICIFREYGWTVAEHWLVAA